MWWISVLQAVQGFVLRCTRVARPFGPVGIDVERPRGALDDLFRDHDLLDAFEAGQVEGISLCAGLCAQRERVW